MNATSQWFSPARDTFAIKPIRRLIVSRVREFFDVLMRRCWRAFLVRRFSYGFVAICTVVSFWLGAYHLGAVSIWGDEGASISIASQHGTMLFHAIAHDGGNFAFYYLLLHCVISLFGTGTDTLRLLSVLCGALCVPLAYALAALLVSNRCGLISAALTATTLPLIYWSHQTRGYTLVVALLTASAVALVIAMRDGGRFAFVVAGVLAVLSCYTELLATVVIFVQFVTLAWTPLLRLRWRQWLITGFGVAIALIPLLLMAKSRGSHQLFWLGAPTKVQMNEAIGFLASARMNGNVTSSTRLLLRLTEDLVFAAVAYGALKSIWTRHIWPLRVVALGWFWLSVPIALAYSVSIHITPIFLDRYFLICLPALTLLLGYALNAIPIVPIAWLGCGLLIGLRSQQLYATHNVTIDNWRGVASQIINQAHPGDCIAFYFNDGFVDFSYYLEHPPKGMNIDAPIPRSVLPALGFGSPPTSRSIGDFPPIVESYTALSARQIVHVSRTCPQLTVLSNHDGHNSMTSGAQIVWKRFVTMRDGLKSAYGHMVRDNLGAIAIYRFNHSGH